MNSVLHRTCAGFLALIFVLGGLPGAASDDTNLAVRATDQRQARTMARELVSAVLDLQLRQLEENGLTDLPLYRDIRTMRGNLAGLIDGEMAAVVEQLVALQQSSETNREARFVEVRRSIREIVVRLSVERRSLLRRLKAAEITEQTRRVIFLQSGTQTATNELSSLANEQRPEAALRILEDQRDVRGLFDALSASLADVATWDGPIATAASEGLRQLDKAETSKALEEAANALSAASFDNATAQQEVVLAALRNLLSSLESAQGTSDSQNSSLADRVQALRERQQSIRDHVEQSGLQTPPESETVEAQQAIANALGELADDLAGKTNASPLRDQAEAAARAATEALFMSQETTTLAEQQRAIDRLTALEHELRREALESRTDRSAAELAKAAESLRQARDELKLAAETRNQVTDRNSSDLQAAQEAERSAAEMTEAISQGKDLPAAAAARLADAAEAARKAAESLTSTGNASEQNQAVAAAGDAFQRAQAAIEESLADTVRAEAAVRIGELARAAEAIERAAAAERELAARIEDSGKSRDTAPGTSPADLLQIQSDISAVAAKTAEGVKEASPRAAETLTKAHAASQEVEKALANENAQPAASDPATASQSTPDQVANHAALTAKAHKTAEHLAGAATELRREIGQIANTLADTVDVQIAPVATAQQAVQQAGDSLKANPAEAAAAARRANETAAQAEVDATTASQLARKALERDNNPTDARDALDRAAISLAAREQQLRQDQQLARQLAQLAEMQQESSETIASARQSLAEAPTDPEAMSPQQQEQAKSLHMATRQFAAAQRATGQGSAMVSGQQQVMNTPIREALQAAERLPIPQLPGEPADAQVAQNSEEGQPAEAAESSESEAGEPGEGESPAGEPSQQTASSGKPGQAGNASSQNGMNQSQGLGTGLVPAAPDETARMMAGPEAQAALAAMAAAGVESMEDVAASETTLDGELPQGTPPSENLNDSLTDSAQGNQTAAASPADSDSQSPTAAPRDATAEAMPNADAPWFAKLPPEVRAGIRASSSQPAPKGYEGRLKRYFESVE